MKDIEEGLQQQQENSVNLSSFEGELQQQENEEELHRNNIVSFNNRENELISQMISNEWKKKEKIKHFGLLSIEAQNSSMMIWQLQFRNPSFPELIKLYNHYHTEQRIRSELLSQELLEIDLTFKRASGLKQNDLQVVLYRPQNQLQMMVYRDPQKQLQKLLYRD